MNYKKNQSLQSIEENDQEKGIYKGDIAKQILLKRNT